MLGEMSLTAVFHGESSRRVGRRCRHALVASIAFSAATAGCAFAIVPPRPPEQEVALVSGGAVWFDEGPVFFEPFGSRELRIGSTRGSVVGNVVSSLTAIAVGEGRASVPPGPLKAISRPRMFVAAGCKAWQADRAVLPVAEPSSQAYPLSR